MRLALVTQWYDPETGSATTFGVIARALRARGHDVHVVTGFPNYPSGSLAAGYTLRPFMREQLGEVCVHRALLYPSHDGNAIKRVLNYVSYALGASLVALLTLRRPHVSLVVLSPPTAVIPALVLKFFRRVPYVVHIHDLWPDSMLSSGMVTGRMASVLRRMLNGLCALAYRESAAIAVTSPGMADVLIARGVAQEKISYIPNWANETIFYPALAQGVETRDPSTVSFMYAGAMGGAQDLKKVILAVSEVGSRCRIRVDFIGAGPAKADLETLAVELGLTNVTFAPALPLAEVAKRMQAADVHIVSLLDSPMFAHTMPSKVANILAAGYPVLGVLSGDAAAVIRESGAGLVVRPGDTGALADAMVDFCERPRKALGEMGRAGRRYYEEVLSEQVIVHRLSSLLQATARA